MELPQVWPKMAQDEYLSHGLLITGLNRSLPKCQGMLTNTDQNHIIDPNVYQCQWAMINAMILIGIDRHRSTL